MHFERLQRMAIVRRDEHDHRHGVDADRLDDVERGRPAELDVQEHNVGPPLDDGSNGVVTPAGLAHAGHALELFQLAAKSSPRDRFIIDDEHLHAGVSR